MPEAASPRLGLIAPSTTDPVASLDEQLRAVVAQLELVVGRRLTVTTWTPSTTPLSSPFPSSPRDGDEHIIRWPASAPSRTAGHWRFLFNDTLGVWEPSGGSPEGYGVTFTPFIIGVANQWQTGATNSGGQHGQGSIYVPFTGLYELEFGFSDAALASGYVLMGLYRVGVDTISAGPWTWSPGGGAPAEVMATQAPLASGIAGGGYARIRPQAGINGGNVVSAISGGTRIAPIFFASSDANAVIHGVFARLRPLAFDPTP